MNFQPFVEAFWALAMSSAGLFTFFRWWEHTHGGYPPAGQVECFCDCGHEVFNDPKTGVREGQDGSNGAIVWYRCSCCGAETRWLFGPPAPLRLRDNEHVVYFDPVTRELESLPPRSLDRLEPFLGASGKKEGPELSPGPSDHAP